MTTETEDYFVCPTCGANVRVGRSGCPKCNPPRERKSWEQDEAYDGVDLQDDDDFDYDAFIADEFGGPKERTGKDTVYLIAGIVLLIALFVLWVL